MLKSLVRKLGLGISLLAVALIAVKFSEPIKSGLKQVPVIGKWFE